MKFDIYLQKISNVHAKNVALKFAAAVMFLAVVVNSYYTYSAVSKQRVIIVPAGGVSGKIEVGGDVADEAYIRMMTRYVAGLFLSYTPGNAKSQYEELLTLYSPERFNDGRSALYDLLENISKADVTSTFHVLELFSSNKGNGKYEIEVKGQRTLASKGRDLEAKKKAYEIQARIINGRFCIDAIVEIDR